MIEVKMKNIVDDIQFFVEFAKMPMKAKVAYQAAKILDIITEEYNRFNTVKNELIQKYGARDDKGELIVDENKNYVLNNDGAKDFAKELSELLESTISINCEEINIDDLNNLDFTPAQMHALMVYLKK